MPIIFRPLINRCQEKYSRSTISVFLLVFLLILVILPIIVIIIVLTVSTLDFVANLSNSTTVHNAINFLVPPITPSNHNNSRILPTSNSTSQTFIDFIQDEKSTTFHILERFLIQHDTITDIVQLFGGKALSVLSTVAGATVQVSEQCHFRVWKGRGSTTIQIGLLDENYKVNLTKIN